MRSLLPVLALPLALLVAACAPDEPVEAESPELRPARIHEVRARDAIVRHRFVGRVEAMQTLDLSFEVPGPLATLSVREGMQVPAGTVLATLDALDYDLAVRQARAQLELARLDLERKRRLLASEGISRSAVDEAATLVELREVALAEATEALDDTRLTAPFDAYVARRFVDPGVNLPPGEPVLRLLDLTQLKIVANVRADLLATVDAERVEDLHATFAFAPQRTFPLTMLENRGEADPVAQTYEIGFSLPYPEGVTLLPGMSATVVAALRAPGAAGDGVPEIPVSALVADARTEDGFFVWRFDAATGAVTRRPVVVGPLTGPTVHVLAGLVPGERIVSAGAAQLAKGMRVRALHAADTP
jgi:RND family efflux transporter MFP subunit